MAIPVFATNDVPSAAQVNDWFVNNIYARKASNESLSSNITLQNDDDLFFPVAALAAYHVSMFLFVASQTAADAKVDFTGPSGFAFKYIIHTQQTGAAAYADDQVFPGAAGTAAGIGGLGGVGSAAVHIEGLVTTAGTSGTFRLQWAQNVSNAAGTTVEAGSFLVARRVV